MKPIGTKSLIRTLISLALFLHFSTIGMGSSLLAQEAGVEDEARIAKFLSGSGALLNDRIDVRLFLDNPERLATVKSVEFWQLAVSESDLVKLTRFPALKSVEFDDCDHLPLEGLKDLVQVESFEFSRIKNSDFKSLTTCTGIRSLDFYACNQMNWDSVAAVMRAAPNFNKLEIRNCKISPQGFGSLSKAEGLESLVLSSLKLDDDAVGRLKNARGLKSLAAYNLNCDGSFLSELSDLDLEEFRFTGPLKLPFANAIGGFRNLQQLTLNSKELLDEDWYKSIGEKCQQLSELQLYSQPAKKQSLDHLSTLTKLETLAISGVGLGSLDKSSHVFEGGSFECVRHFPSLKKLEIGGGFVLNQVDGLSISSAENLEEMRLYNCTFSGAEFSNFKNCKKLTQLELNSCRRMRKEQFFAIGEIPNLVELRIYDVVTRSCDLTNFKKLRNLKKLAITNLKSLKDDGFEFAKGMESLEELTLMGQQRITDDSIEKLASAKKLKKIYLEHVNIDGTGFAAWPAEHPLEELSCTGIVLSLNGLKAIGQLQNLESLFVRVFAIGRPAVEVDVMCFKDSKSLISLVLQGSYQVKKSVADELVKLKPNLGINYHPLEEK